MYERMQNRAAWANALVMTLAAVSACDRGRAVAVGKADLTSAEWSAAYRIGEARCQRQDPACPGAALSSRADCARAKALASATDIQLQQCETEISDAKLNACVEAVRRGACGSGIRAISACRREALCPPRAEEGEP